AVDKFSFIGDPSEDQSNVTYYVDDVIIGIDEAVVQLPFRAPGRRKLFFDYWNEAQRRQRSQPTPMEPVGLSDFGIHQKEVEAFKASGTWELLMRFLSNQTNVSQLPSEAPAEVRRLLQAVALCQEGANDLRNQRPAHALKRFDEAAALVPAGKIYAMNAVLAFAALRQWDAVDERLAAIYADWQDDLRFPPAMAAMGLARQNLDDAERWLKGPAERIPDELGDGLLRRLRSGALTAELLQRLKLHFPNSWDDYVREVVVA